MNRDDDVKPESTDQVIYDLDELARGDEAEHTIIINTANRALREANSGIFAAAEQIGRIQSTLFSSPSFLNSIAAAQNIAAGFGTQLLNTTAASDAIRQLVGPMDGFAARMRAIVESVTNVGKAFQSALSSINKVVPSWTKMLSPLGASLATGIGNVFKHFKQSVFGTSPPWYKSLITTFDFLTINIKAITAHVSGFFKIGNLWDLFQPLVEYFQRFFLRLYKLVVRAANGDEDAVIELSKQWGYLREAYSTLQKLWSGTGVDYQDSTEFRGFVRETAYEFVFLYNDSQRDNYAYMYYRATRYFLSKVNREHKQQARQSRRAYSSTELPLKVVNGKKYMFTHVAAEVAGVTERAINYRVVQGTLPHIKHDYYHKTMRRHIQANLIPYDAETMELLMQGRYPDNGLHKSLLTTEEICDQLDISTRTLLRYEEQKVINPKKYGHRKYYSAEDFVALLKIFSKSKAPRLKPKIPLYQGMLLKYTP